MNASTKDVTATLHYLSTGLVEWEDTPPDEQVQIPQSLRLGLSRMYAAAVLSGKPIPTTLPEFFKSAASPIKSWWEPVKALSNITDTATLIEDGLVSDFAREWALSGKDSIHQIQELPLAKLKEFCERHQLDDSYRQARGELIVAQPVLKIAQLRKKVETKELVKARDFFKMDDEGFYKPVIDLFGGIEYRLCPRCKYIQRLWEGEYICRKKSCELIVRQKGLKNHIQIIPTAEINEWVAVTPGVHRYGTIPGIWELELRDKLVELGAKVTLYPQIDRYDLLVEFPNSQKWAIDVKDWSYVSKERLSKVSCQLGVNATFVVFPDANDLNIPAIRKRKEFQPQALKGLQLRLISEIVRQAKEVAEE